MDLFKDSIYNPLYLDDRKDKSSIENFLNFFPYNVFQWRLNRTLFLSNRIGFSVDIYVMKNKILNHP